ncbi:MAG: nucleotide exchange factor GrpE, partial [Treponema sp.]|nr:nucleotide exchange factor GrpE [Treponema sp.]
IRADVVQRFLPVYDNLERALKQGTEDEAYRKGVEMIMAQFVKTLDVVIWQQERQCKFPQETCGYKLHGGNLYPLSRVPALASIAWGVILQTSSAMEGASSRSKRDWVVLRRKTTG